MLKGRTRDHRVMSFHMATSQATADLIPTSSAGEGKTSDASMNGMRAKSVRPNMRVVSPMVSPVRTLATPRPWPLSRVIKPRRLRRNDWSHSHLLQARRRIRTGSFSTSSVFSLRGNVLSSSVVRLSDSTEQKICSQAFVAAG